MKTTRLLVALAVFTACDFDITDPNNPGPIGIDPSRAEVGAAAAGIVISARGDAADWILDAGIIGREAYRFDGSDPRFIDELIRGPLDPGGGAFGGDHWLEEYATILSANELLNVIGTATRLSAAEQNAARGFAETFQALSFLIVLMGHAEDSIPVDVNRPVTDPPAPFVSNDSAFSYVSALLDAADAHLAAGGTAFSFALPPGFTGFSSVAGFRQFNRALKARVEVYRGSLGCGNPCYTTALTLLTGAVTFIDTSGAATLTRGVYFDYSTNPGDVANPLFQNPITGENVVHPSIRDSIEAKPGGGDDDRYTAKVIDRGPPSSAGDPPLTSDLGWVRYPRPDAAIPIIRNEELILLRAEANNALGNAAPAAADINYIRTRSGGLALDATLAAATPAVRLDQIVQQRTFSLLYEGHRWFDMRRLGRLAQLPIDRTGDVVHASLPTPLNEVLARQ
jgi:hypothetical protein